MAEALQCASIVVSDTCKEMLMGTIEKLKALQDSTWSFLFVDLLAWYLKLIIDSQNHQRELIFPEWASLQIFVLAIKPVTSVANTKVASIVFVGDNIHKMWVLGSVFILHSE